jgi:hypothetical protein
LVGASESARPGIAGHILRPDEGNRDEFSDAGVDGAKVQKVSPPGGKNARQYVGVGIPQTYVADPAGDKSRWGVV